MQKKDFSVFQLENHETKDVLDSHINGELTVIWRNWDEIINKPEMIYLNSVNPGEIKGPHMHKNRTLMPRECDLCEKESIDNAR